MLNEPIEVLNERLVEYFGKDTNTNRPIWRIVWSDDQLEKQLLNYTPEGLELIHPQWYEVPRYKMIGVHSRYVLERYVIVPERHAHEMTVKLSYEPMWVFEDKNGFPLPPKWEACKHIIDTVYLAIGKEVKAKYRDPDSGKSPKELIGEEAERIKAIETDLFGNETPTGDALAHNEGVSYAGLDGRSTKVN